MKRFRSAISDFLTNAGRLSSGGPKLGGAPEARADQQQVDQFRARLLREARVNGLICLIILSLYVLLFLLAAWLIIQFRTDLNAMRLILGGSGLSLLAIMRGLQQLWRQKCALDLFITVIPSLTPTEVARLAESILFSAKPSIGGKRK